MTVDAPGIPPQKALGRGIICLFHLKLFECDEQNMAAHCLNNSAGAMKLTDTLIPIGITTRVVKDAGAFRGRAEIFVRLPLDVTHRTPHLRAFCAAIWSFVE